MSNFHYVYILVDEATGTHFYIGCTEDLKSGHEDVKKIKNGRQGGGIGRRN